MGLTFAEGELLIIAVSTPKAWTVILSDPFSHTYMEKGWQFIGTLWFAMISLQVQAQNKIK